MHPAGNFVIMGLKRALSCTPGLNSEGQKLRFSAKWGPAVIWAGMRGVVRPLRPHPRVRTCMNRKFYVFTNLTRLYVHSERRGRIATPPRQYFCQDHCVRSVDFRCWFIARGQMTSCRQAVWLRWGYTCIQWMCTVIAVIVYNDTIYSAILVRKCPKYDVMGNPILCLFQQGLPWCQPFMCRSYQSLIYTVHIRATHWPVAFDCSDYGSVIMMYFFLGTEKHLFNFIWCSFSMR